ncbi:MAG: PorV/PorQ family protein [Candidatus Marinimicrobia bacterium]|jgi:hypothetical protein|nr:PorV/PorQ family protein [Candidatus Neomarinimicrobiota bacterium]MBT3300511.1 PorV/PorQ family protein [Candidatus Neomarinimicrobiota bacterium]
MKRVLIFSLFFSLSFGQYRDIPEVVTKVATSAGNWLKIETGARAIGMGGAFVAAGEGISGIPYNPASIAFVESSETYFAKTNYLAGITHNVVSYGTRVGSSDFVGFHLFYLNSGDMAVTNEYFPDGTGANFRVLSMAFRLTYARRLTDRLKVGGSLNYIRDQIDETQMQTAAFDIGSNFDTGIYGFILGMSISNFGPEVQYGGEGLHQVVPDTIDIDERLSKITEKFPLPLVFRVGIKNEIMGKNGTFIKNETHGLIVSADAINPSDYTLNGSVGLEYGWKNVAFVRSGYHLGHDTAGFTAGVGANIRMGVMSASVDYAFSDYDVLISTHQVGLSVEF